jgi:hypothetical protein
MRLSGFDMRESPEEDGVRYREDGRIDSDTESQYRYRHRCESSILDQRSKTEANVVE